MHHCRHFRRTISQTNKTRRKRRPARQRDPGSQPRVFDKNNRLIHIGDVISFLTPGRYTSTKGTVYRVVRSGMTVTARDDRNNAITRAPRNVRIIDQP